MKNNILEAGSILYGLTIYHKDGRITRYPTLRNMVGQTMLITGSMRVNTTYSVYLMPTKFGVVPAGTFSMSGNTITRMSGSFDMSTIANYSMIRFADNSIVTVQPSGKTTTSVQTYDSATKAEQTITIYDNAKDGVAGSLGSVNISLPEISYVDGKYSRKITGASGTVSGAGGSVNRLLFYNGYGNLHFDLPAPLVVSSGDIVNFDKFEFSLEEPTALPEAFDSSAIAGIPSSGVHQRLTRPETNFENSGITRIMLVSEANKMAIPNKLGVSTSLISHTGVTKIETISTTQITESRTQANLYTCNRGAYGLVAVGGSVKQIILGDSSSIYHIIEFDTPQVLESGKTLSIHRKEQVIPR